jgi:hypothetical protein
VQDPYDVHVSTTQSTGHGEVEHDWVSLSTGQTLPLFSGKVVTERVRVCVPPPQLTVQDPNDVHVSTTQSTGHGAEEHNCVSLKSGQPAPPFASLTMMARVRVWVPRPHVTEHDPNDVHLSTAQSTAHGIPGSTKIGERDSHVITLYGYIPVSHASSCLSPG